MQASSAFTLCAIEIIVKSCWAELNSLWRDGLALNGQRLRDVAAAKMDIKQPLKKRLRGRNDPDDGPFIWMQWKQHGFIQVRGILSS